MSMLERKYLYGLSDNGSKELDYIRTTIDGVGGLPLADTFTIEGPFVDRPDLISMRYFGNYHLGWLICEYNDIIDPFTEFTLGKKIKIPYLDEYYRFFNRNSRSV